MSDRKRILYIDDSPDPYRTVLDSIRDEFDLVIIQSLDDAVRILGDLSTSRPDCLLIDVYFQGSLPSKLAEYAVGPRRNLLYGQLLAIWMRDQKVKIPYTYLTFIPSSIDRSVDRDDPQYKGIINKEDSGFKPRSVNRTIVEIFGLETK